MLLRSTTLTLTTDGSGAAIGTTGKLTGVVRRIYTSSSNLDATADHTVTDGGAGIATVLFTSGNVAAFNSELVGSPAPITLVDSTITFVIAQGGASKTATYVIVYEPAAEAKNALNPV